MYFDDDIPIPFRNKYEFAEMEIGQSVFFYAQTTQGKAMRAANSHGNYHGKKFSGRTMDGGVRIWRVS